MSSLINYLHFKCESHFGFYVSHENLREVLNKRLLGHVLLCQRIFWVLRILLLWSVGTVGSPVAWGGLLVFLFGGAVLVVLIERRKHRVQSVVDDAGQHRVLNEGHLVDVLDLVAPYQ